MSKANKKQTTSSTSERVTVGQMHTSSFSRRKLALFTLIAIAIITVIGATLLFRAASTEISLTVSGYGKTYELTQAEYDKLISQARSQKVSEKNAKETVIKAHQYKIAAPILKLVPNNEQISRAAQAGAGYSGAGAMNEWQKLYGYVLGVEGNQKIMQTGGYVAAYFKYPFDKVYYDSNLIRYAENRNEAAISTAKLSAAADAARDRQKIVDNELTADALIDKLVKDPKKGSAGGSNGSKWLIIDTHGVTHVADGSLTYTEPDYVMAAINSLGNKPGVSDVREIRATVYGATEPDIIAYFFVSLMEVIVANPNIDGDVKQTLKTIEVINHARQ